jgi:hypothetical protein
VPSMSRMPPLTRRGTRADADRVCWRATGRPRCGLGGGAAGGVAGPGALPPTTPHARAAQILPVLGPKPAGPKREFHRVGPNFVPTGR